VPFNAALLASLQLSLDEDGEGYRITFSRSVIEGWEGCYPFWPGRLVRRESITTRACGQLNRPTLRIPRPVLRSSSRKGKIESNFVHGLSQQELHSQNPPLAKLALAVFCAVA
jgi:hypothetical protein